MKTSLIILVVFLTVSCAPPSNPVIKYICPNGSEVLNKEDCTLPVQPEQLPAEESSGAVIPEEPLTVNPAETIDYFLLETPEEVREAGLPTDIIPLYHNNNRVCVTPMLVIPADASLSDKEIEDAQVLLTKHLAVAQRRYQKILGTTFCVKFSGEFIYHSKLPNSYYVAKAEDEEHDTGHKIAKELLAFRGEDRYSSNSIYLALYVRPADQPLTNGTLFGGGRTLNGEPNSGGGYIELEYSALIEDKPYTFQATLQHELAHSFGLTHVDCFGGEIDNSDSITSYTASHESHGLTESSDRVTFIPQEMFELSLNKRVFPLFAYDASGLDTLGIARCFLGPMKESIGSYKHFPSVGYELFFNGKLVSSPEATLFSFREAKENCEWNKENHKGTRVECRYNGKIFYS